MEPAVSFDEELRALEREVECASADPEARRMLLAACERSGIGVTGILEADDRRLVSALREVKRAVESAYPWVDAAAEVESVRSALFEFAAAHGFSGRATLVSPSAGCSKARKRGVLAGVSTSAWPDVTVVSIQAGADHSGIRTPPKRDLVRMHEVRLCRVGIGHGLVWTHRGLRPAFGPSGNMRYVFECVAWTRDYCLDVRPRGSRPGAS